METEHQQSTSSSHEPKESAPLPTKQPKPFTTTSSRRGGEEVRSLLDMLSLSKYASHFAETGRLNCVQDLIDHPNIWKQIIKGTREKETLEGYLALRSSKPVEEVEASEIRLRTFTVVRTTLKQLRDLQLRKAEMERSFIIQKGVTKKVAKSGKSEAEVRKQLEDLLDEIDDCKERLESAQKEMQANPVPKQQPKKVLKPSTLKPKRPMSATYSGKTAAGEAGGSGIFSPRLSGEKEPEIPGLARPEAYGMGGTAASQPRPSSARPASRPGTAPQQQQQQSASNIKGMPPENSNPKGRGTGKFLFEPDFGNPTSQAAAAKDNDAPTARAPKAQMAAACDVGEGWNRKVPVTKMDLLNHRKVMGIAEKQRRKQQMADDLHFQEELHTRLAAEKRPIRKAQVFQSSSGSNGVHINSTKQQQTLSGGGVVGGGSTAANFRRPASASQGANAPVVNGTAARAAPTRFAMMGGGKDLSLRGLKATKFSLGLSGNNVCIDHNDFIQMKCGAVRYGAAATK